LKNKTSFYQHQILNDKNPSLFLSTDEKTLVCSW